MSDHEQHVKRLRDRAEECRRVAAILMDPQGRLPYLRMAEAYETLAAQEELLSAEVRTGT
jgi:pyruvate kinase